MKKSISLFLIFVIFISTLEGCDFKDIDRRLFIVAIGIDSSGKPNDKLRITFKAAITASTSSDTSGSNLPRNFYLITIEEDSLGKALRLIKANTSLEPDFSHMRVLMFGKKYIEDHSIDSVVEFLMRRRDFQEIIWITISEGSARDVLDTKTRDQTFPGSSLIMKLTEASNSQYIHRTALFNIFSDMSVEGLSSVCPLVDIKGNELVINKLSIIDKGKFKLTLTPEETKVFNILSKGLKTGFLQSKVSEEGQVVEVGISYCKGQFKLRRESNGLHCDVIVKGSGSLESSTTTIGDLNKANKLLEDSLKDDVISLLKKFQQFNVDPFKLQINYATIDSSYKLSKDWLTDKFPTIKFNVVVDFKVDGTGTLK